VDFTLGGQHGARMPALSAKKMQIRRSNEE
jgi:hypothetical protein